tara:strand:- start:728 stop:1078 length:351 start_codon:yes stop_codon:yes gene_type:complete
MSRKREKLQIHVTYDHSGRAKKYEREISLGSFGLKRVKFEAVHEDGCWHTHAILPPTGDKELYIHINTTRDNDEDEAWGWASDDLIELNKESRIFIKDIESLSQVEVSVEIQEQDE